MENLQPWNHPTVYVRAYGIMHLSNVKPLWFKFMRKVIKETNIYNLGLIVGLAQKTIAMKSRIKAWKQNLQLPVPSRSIFILLKKRNKEIPGSF